MARRSGVAKRVGRVAGVLGVLVAVLSLVPATGVAVGRTHAQAPANDGSGWNDRLGQCVAQRKQLDVLFLMDESGSLQTSDANALRVEALKASLLILAQAQSAAPTPPAVNVGIAGFSVGFDRRVPFQPLDASSVGGLVQDAEQFRGRNKGWDTDYYLAMQQSQAWLAEHAAASAGPKGPPCQMIVWFTDGKYDIEDRVGSVPSDLPKTKDPDRSIRLDQLGGGAKLVKAGEASLCKPSGIVDQLRVSNIPIVTVGLGSDDDFAEMRSITQGSDCGTEPPLGQLLNVNDPQDLVFELGGLTTSAGGGTQLPGTKPVVPVCSGTSTAACPDSVQQFTVDPAIGRFIVLGLPQDQGISLSLQAPGAAAPIVIDPPPVGPAPPPQPYEGAHITTTSVGPTVFLSTVDLPPAPAMRGGWTATFIDKSGAHPSSTARSRIEVFADYGISVEPPKAILRGQPADFKISVQTPGTASVKPLPIQGAEVTAKVGVEGSLAAVESVQPAADQHSWVAHTSIPATFGANDLTLEVTVQPRTKDAVFPAQVRTFTFPVRPPDGVPKLVTKQLSFGSISDTGTRTASLVVEGAPDVAGCVQLEPATFAPTVLDAAAPTLSSPTGCIPVAAGQRRTIEVRFTDGKAANLSVTGSLPVRLHGAKQDLNVAIPVQVQLHRSIDIVATGGRAILLLLVGIAVPLLGMWGVGFLLARFRSPGDLHVASYLVEVTQDGVSVAGGQALVPDLKPFQPVDAPPGNVKRFHVGDSQFIARGPKTPFGSASGRSSAPGTTSVGAEGAAGDEALVPLALRTAWVFHADPTSLRIRDDADGPVFHASGSLLLFVRMGADTEVDLSVLQRRLREEVLPAARQLARAAQDADPSDGTGPSESGTTGPTEPPGGLFGEEVTAPAGLGEPPGLF